MINPKVFKLTLFVITVSLTYVITIVKLNEKYTKLNNDYNTLQQEYSKNLEELKELNNLKDKVIFTESVSKMYESLKDYP